MTTERPTKEQLEEWRRQLTGEKCVWYCPEHGVFDREDTPHGIRNCPQDGKPLICRVLGETRAEELEEVALALLAEVERLTDDLGTTTEALSVAEEELTARRGDAEENPQLRQAVERLTDEVARLTERYESPLVCATCGETVGCLTGPPGGEPTECLRCRPVKGLRRT